jgi:hypothetical protein
LLRVPRFVKRNAKINQEQLKVDMEGIPFLSWMIFQRSDTAVFFRLAKPKFDMCTTVLWPGSDHGQAYGQDSVELVHHDGYHRARGFV